MQAAAHETPPAGKAPEVLAALFDQHHEAVFRAAYRVTGNAMDAEDVLQTVFVRLLRRGDGLDLAETAGGYLHRAAVNAALDVMRSRKRAPALPLEDVEERTGDAAAVAPDRSSASRDLARRLRRALARLSPRQAEIFTLRYLEGMGNLEIARLLGSSQTAIAVILHRARHRLQRELGSLQGELS